MSSAGDQHDEDIARLFSLVATSDAKLQREGADKEEADRKQGRTLMGPDQYRWYLTPGGPDRDRWWSSLTERLDRSPANLDVYNQIARQLTFVRDSDVESLISWLKRCSPNDQLSVMSGLLGNPHMQAGDLAVLEFLAGFDRLMVSPLVDDCIEITRSAYGDFGWSPESVRRLPFTRLTLGLLAIRYGTGIQPRPLDWPVWLMKNEHGWTILSDQFDIAPREELPESLGWAMNARYWRSLSPARSTSFFLKAVHPGQAGPLIGQNRVQELLSATLDVPEISRYLPWFIENGFSDSSNRSMNELRSCMCRPTLMIQLKKYAPKFEDKLSMIRILSEELAQILGGMEDRSVSTYDSDRRLWAIRPICWLIEVLAEHNNAPPTDGLHIMLEALMNRLQRVWPDPTGDHALYPSRYGETPFNHGNYGSQIAGTDPVGNLRVARRALQS